MAHIPEWLETAVMQRCGHTLDEVSEAKLVSYLTTDIAFARLFVLKEEPGPWITIRRTLARYDQRTGSGPKVDLDAQYAAMSEHPELARIAKVACATTFDTNQLAGYGCDVWAGDDGRSAVVRVVVEGARDWPDALGGPAQPIEIERRFSLWVRQAPWRDRRVRRLVRVDVHNVEVHADPCVYLFNE